MIIKNEHRKSFNAILGLLSCLYLCIIIEKREIQNENPKDSKNENNPIAYKILKK